MANDVRSLAPLPRELPLRDVRDLALAVIEGAVAAESLAKELKRTPDRSRHFQEIAERLRAVVGRPSIRTALSEDAARTAPTTMTVETPVQLPTPAHLRSAQQTSSPPPLPSPPSERPVPSERAADGEPARSRPTRSEPTRSEPTRSEPTRSELTRHDLARVETLVAALPNAERVASLEARLGRLEELLTRAIAAREEGEQYALRAPEEAIALAARLTERLRREPRVVVRIEPAR